MTTPAAQLLNEMHFQTGLVLGFLVYHCQIIGWKMIFVHLFPTLQAIALHLSQQILFNGLDCLKGLLQVCPSHINNEMHMHHCFLAPWGYLCENILKTEYIARDTEAIQLKIQNLEIPIGSTFILHTLSVPVGNLRINIRRFAEQYPKVQHDLTLPCAILNCTIEQLNQNNT